MQKKEIRIIGVPMDLGQNQRGVDMGPSAIRYAGLAAELGELGFRVRDIGNIEVPVRASLPTEQIVPAVAQACELVYAAARQAVADNCLPLFLGGDHSVAIGTIGGVSHDVPTGVIWIDAHGDFNTPEASRTNNIHGMALAVLAGLGSPDLVDIGRPGPKIRPADTVMIGVRDLDSDERTLLKKSGIIVYTMRDVDEQGINLVTRKALRHLDHLDRIHVSLDLDCLDPLEAPGVGTPVDGGLTYREAQLAMEIIADAHCLSSMDLVEINPILDHRNHTAQIAMELALSIFGKSIL